MWQFDKYTNTFIPGTLPTDGTITACYTRLSQEDELEGDSGSILNQLLIGQSSTEGERKKRERSRLKRQKLLPSGEVDICPPILELRDKEYRDKNLENREGVCARAVHGRYQNVFLSDIELAELQTDFPTVWQEYIERLSEYMASTGRTYKSHVATIRRWIADDWRKAAPAVRDRDYSVKEGDTV